MLQCIFFITHRSFLLHCHNQFIFLMEEIKYTIKPEHFLYTDLMPLPARGVLSFVLEQQ